MGILVCLFLASPTYFRALLSLHPTIATLEVTSGCGRSLFRWCSSAAETLVQFYLSKLWSMIDFLRPAMDAAESRHRLWHCSAWWWLGTVWCWIWSSHRAWSWTVRWIRRLCLASLQTVVFSGTFTYVDKIVVTLVIEVDPKRNSVNCSITFCITFQMLHDCSKVDLGLARWLTCGLSRRCGPWWGRASGRRSPSLTPISRDSSPRSRERGWPGQGVVQANDCCPSPSEPRRS